MPAIQVTTLQEMFKPLLKELIWQEMGKAQPPAASDKKRVEEIVQVIDEGEIPLDETIMQNVSTAIRAFRKRGKPNYWKSKLMKVYGKY